MRLFRIFLVLSLTLSAFSQETGSPPPIENTSDWKNWVVLSAVICTAAGAITFVSLDNGRKANP